MTAPNRNALWAQAIVEELVAAGVDAACLTPGSRSTPLAVAFATHDDVHVFSHLDERSSAFFALGRARRTGRVTPIVCTSGTAAANFHPAVLEADRARVPLLALTADRPPELRDSGANQTVDQEKLYGGAVRYYKDLPEPEAAPRKLRSLRTTVARALSAAEGTPAGPVHLNVPFAKPLEPTAVEGDVPDDLDPVAAEGRRPSQSTTEPFVDRMPGTPELDDGRLRRLADDLEAERGLIVAGPADPPRFDRESIVALSHATGYPILADPLSGLRFGGHVRVAPVISGYDGYLTVDPDDAPAGPVDDWPAPEVVLRLGASPTSKPLREYLARTGADQYVVDPAGEWREAEFSATDLVVADPSRLCARLSEVVRGRSSTAEQWRRRWETADRIHFEEARKWIDRGDGMQGRALYEGWVLADVVDLAPDPATVFVSNSMPVRDADRFAAADTSAVTMLGNRGVSGIDGIASTALGAGSGTTDELICVLGDLAFYHDMNGLLALDRCGIDATFVLVNNDGGGIFHKLPIERFDPPFTRQFKTPHGLDFEPSEELYGFSFARVDARPESALETPRQTFRDRLSGAIDGEGSHVVELRTDANAGHRAREALEATVLERVAQETQTQ
ncbi:2-succinyl-5-enolpyruvyl-6-hydroxy-3-cyclohexene-1-carboxylate synthase [Halalkaliarchaeum desulfuricum]|uniref:2-succinyl-5-enolpyruvyl-6-hydroxy-3-cyclohexene-1-carboxylate synthase n=1 Tax=Halalkaliarchaeum desulfuricum TaxID=2055893 RepID=A0A343THW4_9EURY|nr:2-succinyl-5-enolpyruvyl-6-hydroxy-3-cyclohexene-1-carboxylic-acid synthase [Halalkaliarchaeum desulfuricum]AUX08686.1 2-succinyl-5-enolpyruvyl-6-hydroxy-3-cyclohexene-1-carboxylate synthase [Halalkaliarchaeum desulfuricum]